MTGAYGLFQFQPSTPEQLMPDPLRRVPTEDVRTSEEVAALCRAHPGRWAEVDVVVPEEGEAELRAVVQEAQDPAFAPAGSFQMTLSHPGRKLRVMYRKPKIDLNEAIMKNDLAAAQVAAEKLIRPIEIKQRTRSASDDARILKIVNGQLRPDAADLAMMTDTERRLYRNSKQRKDLEKWGLGKADKHGRRPLIREETPPPSNHSGTYDRYGNYRGVMQPGEYVPGNTNPREDVGDRYYAQSGKAHFEEIDTIARWLREED